MPAISTLTADGLPRIIADADLIVGWQTAAAVAHDPIPDCAYGPAGRASVRTNDTAPESPALIALHTYWVAG
jgi:hypothetical protein